MTESTDPNLLIEQYLDGALDPAAQLAFERRLATDSALAADVELQRRIDASLKRTFTASQSGASSRDPRAMADRIVASLPDSSQLPQADRPLRVRRRLSMPIRIAAIITLLVGVPLLVLEWKNVAGRHQANQFADLRSMPLDELYQKQLKEKSFEPQWACDPETFAGYFRDRLGQPLKFSHVPDGAQKWGVSYVGGLSARSITVSAIVDGVPILVCADRFDSDKPLKFATDSALHSHRRVIGDLVLYEVSSLDKPKLLDLFYQPQK